MAVLEAETHLSVKAGLNHADDIFLNYASEPRLFFYHRHQTHHLDSSISTTREMIMDRSRSRSASISQILLAGWVHSLRRHL